MKIRKIKLNNFKRFTNLTITGIPETTKLVVLIGPNGCGKSSVFDAIYVLAMRNYVSPGNQWQAYYVKEENQGAPIIQTDQRMTQLIDVQFHENNPTTQEMWRKVVYPRTAYRNVASFNIQQLHQIPSVLEENRFYRFSEDDRAANDNYVRLVSKGLQDAFEKESPETTIKKFRANVIGEVADGLKTMFPELVLNSLRNPLTSVGTFRFDKGDSKGFPYENLSGGEKAAFDLILDLVVKRDTFNDTVYCIDEPEAHMSTRLQKNLLACLYNLIPDNCQLWIATHSIGMIRKARDLQNENSDTVTFLDFDDKDFDKPQTIEPVIPTRTFWQKTYKIALDDLAELIVPNMIILCEGEPGKKGFDAQCYNAIFGDEFPDALFVSAKGSGNVKNLQPVIQAIAEKAEVISLIDRDNRTDTEREQERQKGVFVLRRRALENYLIDDEIIRLLCREYEGSEKVENLIRARDTKINNEDAGTAVSAKTALEEIRLAAQDHLSIPHPGDKWQSFVYGYIVPLVTPDTEIYRELKTDIFGDGNEYQN